MAWRFWRRMRQEVRDNPVARAIALWVGQSPVWTPRHYLRLAREGYEQNATIYACVRQIAISQAGIPWYAYQKSRLPRGKRQALETHPVLDLLERPNPFQGQAAFIETHTAYLQLAGNAYFVGAGPDRRDAPPRELWHLRPDRMSLDPDPVNLVRQYVYARGESGERAFTPEQIMHRRYFHPTNEFMGLSPLQVAGRAMDQDNAAQAWNYALLKRGGHVSGALQTKKTLGSIQRQILQAEIDEQIRGESNAGQILLLEGDLEWTQMGINLQDAHWPEGRRMSMLDICKAFGVPPELVGDAEHKIYANWRESRQSFYMEKIIPEMVHLRDDLNNWLCPQFDDRIRLDFDTDQIEALQESRDTLWARAERAWWLTLNQRREMIGYEPIEGGDVLFIPSGLVPMLPGELVLPDEPMGDPENPDDF